jgi:hypothetical protein
MVMPRYPCAGTYDYMGYTMRTDSVRFTVWLPFDDDSARPIWPDLDDMGALPPTWLAYPPTRHESEMGRGRHCCSCNCVGSPDWMVAWGLAGERIELYDLSTDDGRNFDFDGYSLNLANTPAYASTVQELWAELKAEVSKWL